MRLKRSTLSAAARRQLFGRDGGPRAAKHVINFNTDQEYQHNETVRAAGEQQIHQPVRALQGGKHSLRQLVQNVHNQREALEDSFAKGKSNRKEASSRYGW
ncbi:mitotic checkpoint regulator, MAD2B-interacting domain-containing protein [Hirsutella rhossiliensis]